MKSKSKEILIVDAASSNRRAVCLYLNLQGYRVLEAGDGMEALDVVSRHDIGLILMDLAKPCLDGYAVVEQIRDRSGDVGVIFMGPSGNRICPSAAYLPKPFSPAALLGEIDRQLGRPRRLCS